MKRWSSVLFLFAAANALAKPVDFVREIRPILSDSCFTCHGPDEKERKANLRLDTREGAFAPRGGAAVIIPGDSGKSRLLQRVSHAKPALRMPPPNTTAALNEKQIELIKRWIEEGANWQEHWAYAAPKRPAMPETQFAKWVRNPIDAFVAARLEKEGLKPSAEADRATLLRRVTLDITGLPPTPAERDAFLADRSADAYEKAVDRLLSSPRYGERMALPWLDLARYTDTHGYHIDSHRDMWHWRDWVIGAFNRNMPFDQFTIEQLAGDLLPNASTTQKIATGFNRNHMINFEGGAIPEEYQNEYVIDRVETTSVVWLGMTMGCARCHDHKYDPIKQKDFYRLYAFFNTISEKGLDGTKGNAEPKLQLPSDQQRERLDALAKGIKGREAALPDSRLDKEQKAWEAARLEAFVPASREGLTAHYEMEGSFADTSGAYQNGRLLSGEPTYSQGPAGRAAEFDGETHVVLGNRKAFSGSEPFTLSFLLRISGQKEMTVIEKLSTDGKRRGFEFSIDDHIPAPDLQRASNLIFRLSNEWPANAIAVRTKQRVLMNEWLPVALTYDGSGKAAGLKLFVDGKPRELEVLADALSSSIANDSPLEISNKAFGKPFRGALDELRIYSRAIGGAEAGKLAVEEPARALLYSPAAKRSKFQSERLRDYWLTYEAPEADRKLYAELKAMRKEKELLDKVVPTTMIMAEMEKPRETAILGRGDYRNRGEIVKPGVPSVLPPLPKDAPANRLGLASWLVSPSHPLTARVAVNRFWQMYFGNGLVKTAEDFGSQGESPANQELLDWLATEFIAKKWDMKAMQRLIVTSATYRQSSKAPQELIEKDPENRLLARGPRFRLPAELVRDNALYVSGLLNEKVGGPSVFPYQPKGIWEDIAYGDIFSAQTYTPSHGPDLYRKSMYSFWKRTMPPPGLATFDAPDREKCAARRPMTNTPLQALVLLNDPTYIEAARVLAERMIRQGGGDAAKRIAVGFELATARKPKPQEQQVLREMARLQTAEYKQDRAAAGKLVAVGESKADPKLDVSELAAWTTVASTILNLDETITKE